MLFEMAFQSFKWKNRLYINTFLEDLKFIIGFCFFIIKKITF